MCWDCGCRHQRNWSPGGHMDKGGNGPCWALTRIVSGLVGKWGCVKAMRLLGTVGSCFVRNSPAAAGWPGGWFQLRLPRDWVAECGTSHLACLTLWAAKWWIWACQVTEDLGQRPETMNIAAQTWSPSFQNHRKGEKWSPAPLFLWHLGRPAELPERV